MTLTTENTKAAVAAASGEIRAIDQELARLEAAADAAANLHRLEGELAIAQQRAFYGRQTLTSAEANLDAIETAIRATPAKLDELRFLPDAFDWLAAGNLERVAQLHETRDALSAWLESAPERLKVAKSSVRAAKSRAAEVESEIAGLESRVNAARAAVKVQNKESENE